MTEGNNQDTGPACPKCSGPMGLKHGPYGPFWGCFGYPECKGTRNANGQHKANGAALGGNGAADETVISCARDVVSLCNDHHIFEPWHFMQQLGGKLQRLSLAINELDRIKATEPEPEDDDYEEIPF